MNTETKNNSLNTSTAKVRRDPVKDKEHTCRLSEKLYKVVDALKAEMRGEM
jgi:hypothetical protein